MASWEKKENELRKWRLHFCFYIECRAVRSAVQGTRETLVIEMAAPIETDK